eukprot:8732934-Alexandrium_andersonii.AAC.1
MSASLVGSEMCIRDSRRTAQTTHHHRRNTATWNRGTASRHGGAEQPTAGSAAPGLVVAEGV